jgi:hypothetical protein
MSLAERCCCGCGVLLAALVVPAEAAAHGGKSAPVASDFEARIDGVRPASGAIEAKVVDADQALWLRPRGSATVLVPGAVGEPLLRFGPGGVYLNLRSPTAQADRIDTVDLQPDPTPRAAPLWHRLTSERAYRWHDHRVHALASLARSRPQRWSVPLVVDGRLHRLVGMLVYRSPVPAWPWILLACALAAGALAAPLVAAPAAVALVWTVRVGRELYGRPDVGASGYAEIVLTSLIGAALLAGLVQRDAGVRWFVALLVAVGCLYQGVTMLPVLTHSIALTALPTRVAQAALAAILGLGGGLSVIAIRQQLAPG